MGWRSFYPYNRETNIISNDKKRSLRLNSLAHIKFRADGFEEIVVCPLCGATDIRAFPAASYNLNLLPPISVTRCQKCLLAFLSPRPGLSMRNSIFRGALPEPLAQYKSLMNYGNIAALRSSEFNRRLIDLENILLGKMRRVRFKGALSILDIGAANGTFLKMASDKGWEAYGLEASQKEVEEIQDISVKKNIIIGTAENIPFASSLFDCVHSHHVWEHLLDPLKASNEVYRILKPKGIFYFEVPNQFENIIFRRDMLIKRVWQIERSMCSIHHNYFFSIKTMNRILENTGFKWIKIKSKYEGPMRGWKIPFAMLTRIAGTLIYGGNIIYGYGIKPGH